MRNLVWTFATLTLTVSAAAAEPRYSDERSSAQALIRSLYNAINRHEYARAWDYFETQPASSFDAYVKGFEDTKTVEVVTGIGGSEGAAGSIFYEVPVAISAKDGKGKETFFSGCYTVRQVNGTIQDPPSRPLRISKASLKPSKETSLLGSLPEKCGDVPPPDYAETLRDNVTEMFLSDARRDLFCNTASQVEAGKLELEVHEFKYKAAGSGDKDPPSVATLFAYPCGSGAYNTVEFYYLNIDEQGPARLTFAEPRYDYKYADEESAKLTSMSLKGFTSTGALINSGFDGKTNSLTSFSKWRGLGDASSKGTWVFSDGAFVLRDYDIDPTFDEEINPISVMKDGQLLVQKTP
jgi:Protein of unknown function (DUF1176)